MPTFSNYSPGTHSYTIPAGATEVSFSVAGAGGGGSKPVGGEWYHDDGGGGRAGNFTIGGTIMSSYTGHAKAFAMLQETGVELSPMAIDFIAYFGTEASGPNPIMLLVGVCGLLIALAPLWFNPNN